MLETAVGCGNWIHLNKKTDFGFRWSSLEESGENTKRGSLDKKVLK